VNEPGLIEELLHPGAVIALYGYSPLPGRASNGVAEYLRRNGYRVIAVSPKVAGEKHLGETAYPRIQDIPDRVDFVDVFRRGEFLDEVVDDAIAAKAPAIWFQLALGNVAAAERAERLGLRVVWDRCTAIEHGLLGLGPRG